MSKQEKLLKRFLSLPADLTWEELEKVLAGFGYNQIGTGKTSGSRRRFVDRKKNICILHKPHPGNIIKRYAIEQVIAELLDKGHIKNE